MNARLWQVLALLAVFSVTTEAVVCRAPLDIAIVLDSSGSVSLANWQLMKGFTNNIINQVHIGPSSIRMAIMQFSSSVTMSSNLPQHMSNQLLITVFQQIVKASGGTNTHLALNAVRTQVFGANPRNVPKIVILLTDGQSNNMGLTVAAANNLNTVTDVHVFAVGIGGFNIMEINAISSNPDSIYSSTLTNFNFLNVIASLLGEHFCNIGLSVQTSTTCTTDADCSSTDNSICNLGLCSCLSRQLFHDISLGNCIPRTSGSAVCNIDNDCALTFGAICALSSGLCTCPIGTTCQDCQLGTPCGPFMQCVIGIPGWLCTGGIQTCSESRVQNGDYNCRVRGVGDPCTADAQCLEVNGTCVSGQCQCSHTALIYDAADVLCRPREVGESCTLNSHCGFINDAICTLGICTCPDPFVSTSGNVCGSCVSTSQILNPATAGCRNKVLDDPCTTDSDCQNIANAVCEAGQCSCAPMYGRVGSSKTTCAYCGIGTFCPTGVNCLPKIPYSSCNGNILICAAPSVQFNMQCRIPVINSVCGVNSDCFHLGQVGLPYVCTAGKCACAFGYKPDSQGLTCEEVRIGSLCKGSSDCSSIPDTVCSGTCQCRGGFFPHADQKRCLGPCLVQQPCLNGGTCTHTPSGSFSCACLPGYTGNRCQNIINLCATVVCVNGFCNPLTGRCICNPGTIGPNCMRDPCASLPCRNGGTCFRRGSNSYTCRCPIGFTGSQCQTPTCFNGRCLNGGTCLSLANNRFTCRCRPGFSGEFCQIRSPCPLGRCQNGGTCRVIGAGQFRCDCPPNFIGNFCETLRTCPANRCLNGGTCRLRGNGNFWCECVRGFTGQYCQIPEGAPCRLEPCKNAGTCMANGANNDDFSCRCKFGYTGPTCEDVYVLALCIGAGIIAIFAIVIIIMCFCRCNGYYGHEKKRTVILSSSASEIEQPVHYVPHMATAPYNSQCFAQKPAITYFYKN